MTTRMSMTAATQSMTMGLTPSRSALATRSLRLAERLRDEGKRDEYAAAIAQHFTDFSRPAACRVA